MADPRSTLLRVGAGRLPLHCHVSLLPTLQGEEEEDLDTPLLCVGVEEEEINI